MKGFCILILTASLLAGCSSGPSQPSRTASRAPVPVAAGPINNACLASGREARSRRLCGCIQSVANQTLTASEQRRAASFYSDPQLAQAVRASDTAANDRFWEVYAAYAERAERVCG